MEATRSGWSTGQGSIESVRREAARLGYTEVAIRRGAPAVATLKPTSPDVAAPKSLSAIYGLGEQPLHSDGAHMTTPPDIVVLASEDANETPTRLWKMPRFARTRERFPYEKASHGVFLVSNGKDSFYAHALEKVSPLTSRLRYDPGCMVPCDARARAVVNFFEAELDAADEHSWENPGTILVINNSRALHARASAINEPDRELQRIAFTMGGKK